MDLANLAVFVEAVKSGSLAGAARRLRISAMSATRSLAALEAELDVRLIHRTTRSLAPTAAGEAFLPHAIALLEAQEEAISALAPGDAGLSGALRITASSAFGRKFVAPMLAQFMIDHPALQVDLLLTDEQVDIVGQGIDVAIRIARLRENHLVAKRIVDNPRMLCASPAYLARHGRPGTLAELAAHSCLLTTGTTHWEFVRNGRSVRQKVAGRLTANSVEALFEACAGGLGIINLSARYVARAVAAGTLEEVRLADAEPQPLAVWAVYPTARLVPAKVRAFIAALTQALTENGQVSGRRV